MSEDDRKESFEVELDKLESVAPEIVAKIREGAYVKLGVSKDKTKIFALAFKKAEKLDPKEKAKRLEQRKAQSKVNSLQTEHDTLVERIKNNKKTLKDDEAELEELRNSSQKVQVIRQRTEEKAKVVENLKEKIAGYEKRLKEVDAALKEA